MSTRKVKCAKGQLSLEEVLNPKQGENLSKKANPPTAKPSNPTHKVNKDNKKRTPPSAESRETKKTIHKLPTEDSPAEPISDLGKNVLATMEVQNSHENGQEDSLVKTRPGLESDMRFKNLSEEFIAFGNLMCDKLHEIVEPLRNSNDELQKLFHPIQMEMKTVLGNSRKIPTLEETCKKVRVEQVSCNVRLNKIEEENKELKTRLTKLENKMLGKNLIFHGIKEDNWDLEDNAKERIWRAISHTVDSDDNRKRLKIARSIPICSTTWLGHYREGHNRPISVSFEKKSHMETLYRNKKHLPKGIYMDREYTAETEKSRKILHPILRLAKSLPHYKSKCKMEEDYLVILGKKYTTKSLHKLPTDINGFAASSRSDTDTTTFFGELNPFSNFHFSPFHISSKDYHCSEQYIQEAKALHFNDTKTTEDIMKAETAIECKNLSRGIVGYNHDDWKQNTKQVCKPSLAAKFGSNPLILTLLHSTGKKVIAEACHDTLWGTGVPLRHKDCLKKESWHGIGILGEILMELRSEIPNTDANNHN